MTRTALLLAALVVSLAATAVVALSEGRDDEVGLVVERRPARDPSMDVPPTPVSDRPEPRSAQPLAVAAPGMPEAPQAGTPTPLAGARGPWPGLSAAAQRAWGPPPAPPPPPAPLPAPAPPAAPSIPAFPYQWIGRLDDADGTKVLLSGPQRSFGARVGDVIDGAWRVDRIEDSRLDLTWLPGGSSLALEAGT